MKEFMKEK